MNIEINTKKIIKLFIKLINKVTYNKVVYLKLHTSKISTYIKDNI